jgi:hypothetical protein
MPKKKPTKTQLKKKADTYFSKWIRRRDGVCQSTRLLGHGAAKCTRELNLQCAHIHTRDYSATRLDPENAVALCKSCHVFFTLRPLEWRAFINTLFDDSDYYERMGRRAFAGAQRLAAVDWGEKAEFWREQWGE